MPPASAQEKLYTIDDIYHLPEGSRAELIDGQIYSFFDTIRVNIYDSLEIDFSKLQF